MKSIHRRVPSGNENQYNLQNTQRIPPKKNTHIPTPPSTLRNNQHPPSQQQPPSHPPQPSQPQPQTQLSQSQLVENIMQQTNVLQLYNTFVNFKYRMQQVDCSNVESLRLMCRKFKQDIYNIVSDDEQQSGDQASYIKQLLQEMCQLRRRVSQLQSHPPTQSMSYLDQHYILTQPQPIPIHNPNLHTLLTSTILQQKTIIHELLTSIWRIIHYKTCRRLSDQDSNYLLDKIKQYQQWEFTNSLVQCQYGQGKEDRDECRIDQEYIGASLDRLCSIGLVVKCIADQVAKTMPC